MFGGQYTYWENNKYTVPRITPNDLGQSRSAAELIPARITYFDHPLFDTYRHHIQAFVGGWSQDISAAKIKSGTVMGALQNTVFHAAAGNFAAVMGTAILNRDKVSVYFENGDHDSVDLYYPDLFCIEINRRGDLRPVTHYMSPSCRRASSLKFSWVQGGSHTS